MNIYMNTLHIEICYILNQYFYVYYFLYQHIKLITRLISMPFDNAGHEFTT